MLMANDRGDPGETLDYALKTSREVLESHQATKAVKAVSSPHSTSWSKPSDPWIKVNVDAGLVGSLGCGLGVVCRESSGAVLAAGSFQFAEVWETRVAEAKAIFYGLKVARELGYASVEVEGDSLVAIQALKREQRGCSDFDLIIDDVLELATSFDKVVWSFVKRSGNSVAHMLAHLQPWEIGRRLWVDDIPNDVISLALKDII